MLRQLRYGQGTDVHRRQLYRQGQAVQPLADRVHSWTAIVSIWARAPCPLAKQGDRVLERQGGERKDRLTAQPQRRTAGDEQHDVRALGKHLCPPPSRLGHLLCIVEDEQDVSHRQVCEYLLRR